MAGQLQGSLPVIERAPLPRYAYVFLLFVTGALLLWIGWNDAAASTSVLHNRLFLLASALVFAVVGITLVLVPWRREVRAWLIAAHLLVMGLYLGMAIATTDWSDWPMRGWWQGWWTPPFLAAQIHQMVKLVRYAQ